MNADGDEIRTRAMYEDNMRLGSGEEFVDVS